MAGGREAARVRVLKAADGTFQNPVQDLAKRICVKLKGLFGLARFLPAKPIPPKIAERVPQQAGERRCRLLPLQRRQDKRMVRAHQTVMGGELALGMPVGPTAMGGPGGGQGFELCRPGEEPVGPAGCMLGDAGALAVVFRPGHRGVER